MNHSGPLGLYVSRRRALLLTSETQAPGLPRRSHRLGVAAATPLQAGLLTPIRLMVGNYA